MNEKSPCYETAEQNTFARFEVAQQGSFALPYSTLLFAHLTPTTTASAAQVLTLLYTTHTVSIHGTQLSSLFLAFQKGRAEAVRIGGGQPNGTIATPAVREITVAEGPTRNL